MDQIIKQIRGFGWVVILESDGPEFITASAYYTTPGKHPVVSDSRIDPEQAILNLWFKIREMIGPVYFREKAMKNES